MAVWGGKGGSEEMSQGRCLKKTKRREAQNLLCMTVSLSEENGIKLRISTICGESKPRGDSCMQYFLKAAILSAEKDAAAMAEVQLDISAPVEAPPLLHRIDGDDELLPIVVLRAAVAVFAKVAISKNMGSRSIINFIIIIILLSDLPTLKIIV